MPITRFFLLMALASSVGCAAAAPGLPAPVNETELRNTTDVRAVFQISDDGWKEDVGEGLFYVRKVVGAYEALGVALEDLHFVVVLHGDAGYWALEDEAWQGYEGPRAVEGESNPNAATVAELDRMGVRVELCASTMRQRGWTAADLLPAIIVTPGAYPRVIDLQMEGYSHIVFD